MTSSPQIEFSGKQNVECRLEMWQRCPLPELAVLSPALSCMNAPAESLLTQKKVDWEQIKIL